ncbi:ImmA/IrrE family metallo-endopeptidase [Salegentibacter sp. JZCK2]|uniref:ImmA/IrrE family metallo-endopeptidase n=1 Tax=Salegentibacter tibetensis TaxID=2873600 RepID=UPI001CCE5165|nr:ImmA/IrrE family metallo-endopeptidase [Salegentibacter tibetensis]MBZ9728559.1 ImmA/IrrE family metallo-endopeptidase [Salegentibacter tibetensis]
MVNRIENINYNLIEWAITRAGFKLEDFFAKNPKVEEWIKGNKYPTIKQLEDFTHKVHVPFGYLFLNEPPQEELNIPFFRTGKEDIKKVSLNIYHTVQMLQERQSWLTDYLTESGYDNLSFVGAFDENDNYKEIVSDIRKTLNLSEGWAKEFRTWEETLDYLSRKIEDTGIIVTFNGVVGNNTRRRIDVEECRGFVLVNDKAPFLFINSADAKAAQMFTLIHELAHIWLGESAGFNNDNMLPADDPIEKLCDKVAAEFLVPETHFRKLWLTTQNFKTLSRNLKVSPIVVSRRAFDLKLITKEEFFEFYNSYIKSFHLNKENQASGGNFYSTARKRVSLRFANYVNTAVKENNLLYRDAYRLTNLRGNTYEKFVNEYLYQV